MKFSFLQKVLKAIRSKDKSWHLFCLSMSQLKTSSSERTSIHDMLKETSATESRGSVLTTVETKAACPYSRSVPVGLSSCTSSPAILTPTTPTHNEDATVTKATSRIENIKNWSISTYKCTKQLMFEKLGKSSRTIDAGKYSFQLGLLMQFLNFTFHPRARISNRTAERNTAEVF